MLKAKAKVSLIVPVYNEEKSIGKALQQIEQLHLLLSSMEVIVVDDGSTDQTASEVAKFPFVKCLVHGENRGKGAALCTGFQSATGDIFVIQDADLEYPPSNIPKLLEPILDGRADVVYGSRFKGRHDGMSFSHYVGNKILSLTARLLHHAPITDVMTGHKCFRKEVIESVDLTEDGFEIETEITAKILKSGWRFHEVPIVYSKRSHGSAKIKYRDGLGNMLKLLEEFIPIFSHNSQLHSNRKTAKVRAQVKKLYLSKVDR